jgi:hypothetical protein
MQLPRTGRLSRGELPPILAARSSAGCSPDWRQSPFPVSRSGARTTGCRNGGRRRRPPCSRPHAGCAWRRRRRRRPAPTPPRNEEGFGFPGLQRSPGFGIITSGAIHASRDGHPTASRPKSRSSPTAAPSARTGARSGMGRMVIFLAAVAWLLAVVVLPKTGYW